MQTTQKHPGFNKVSAMMARSQGISKKGAAAELAASSRNASPAAKKANPNLKKVAGKPDTSEPDADDKTAK